MAPADPVVTVEREICVDADLTIDREMRLDPLKQNSGMKAGASE
jgi:hypothetical protein